MAKEGAAEFSHWGTDTLIIRSTSPVNGIIFQQSSPSGHRNYAIIKSIDLADVTRSIY